MRRYYGYKKKKLKLNGKLVTVIVCFMLCVAATVFYGNHLKKKALESQTLLPETSETDNVSETTENIIKTHDVRSVNAVLLPQEWASGTEALKTAVAGITSSGHDAATIVLRHDDGYPMYASGITASVSQTGATPPPVALTELISELHKAGVYICGYFKSGITGGSGYTSEFIRSYEIALIGELYAAGIDEILLDGLDPDSTSMTWISDLYAEIRKSYPNLVIGITVPAQAVLYDNSSVLFNTLSNTADFIALDMSKTETDGYKKLLSDSTLYFSKYNIRALIAAADTEQLSQRLSILNDAAVHNRQIIMQKAAG